MRQQPKRQFQDVDVKSVNRTEQINSVEDLPPVENGFHQLEDMTEYRINGFISLENGLEMGTNTPVCGFHGGSSALIYSGDGSVFKSQNESVFINDIFVIAPGATLFDLVGGNNDLVIDSLSTKDEMGMGNLANLGVIDGFRVPSFKRCNFEDFNDGLTFTGNSNKIFIEGTPFRNVGDDVRIFEFDANLETDIIDIVDCYITKVQPETEVVFVDPQAQIVDQFQYRGTTHGQSITRENILAEDLDKNNEPFWVSDSFPLADTTIYGSYVIDDEGEVVINSQATGELDEAAYEMVDIPTTERGLARFEHTSPGQLEYVGRRSRSIQIDFSVAGETGNDEVLVFGVFKNGSLLPTSATPFVVQQLNFAGGTTIAGSGDGKVIVEETEPNDEFMIGIANLGSDTNIDLVELSVDAVKA